MRTIENLCKVHMDNAMEIDKICMTRYDKICTCALFIQTNDDPNFRSCKRLNVAKILAMRFSSISLLVLRCGPLLLPRLQLDFASVVSSV